MTQVSVTPALLPTVESLPAPLVAHPNWLAWRSEQRGEKWTKVPYSPRTGRLASSVDSSTWSTFAGAASYAARVGCNGVGFVFTGTPFTGIDLDHCLDPVTSELAAWAVPIVARFKSYTEISPSGTGLHIYVEGTLPGGGRKVAVSGASHLEAKIEVYDSGRYFTVTGRHWPGTPLTVASCQDVLLAWHTETFPPEALPAATPREVAPVDVDDADLIELASHAKNGVLFTALWRGDLTEHGGDRSAADLALCNLLAFWTGGDPTRMDALFRQSGLYRRKWDQRHYRDGTTYGAHTIAKALAEGGEYFAGPALSVDATKPEKTGREAKEEAKSAKAAKPAIEIVDAATLMQLDFPTPRYAVPELLPEGLSILSGKPKQGKSWLALGIALSVTSGTLALGKIEVEQGEVLYLALEDGQRRIQRRLNDLLGDIVPPPLLHVATKWPPMDDGGLTHLRAWLDVHPSTRLVVIDTFTRFRPEEKRGVGIYRQDYSAVIPLSDLAHERNISIVIVMHNRKTESEDPMDLVSGSLGLSGAGDGVLVMKRERGSADAMLHVFDRDQEDKTVALRWNIATGGWLWLGDAEQYRRSQQRNEVLAALHDFGPSTPKELADRMGKNRGTINRLLWELRQTGAVTNAGGVYMAIADRPADVPSFLSIYPQGEEGEEGEEGEAPKRAKHGR